MVPLHSFFCLFGLDRKDYPENDIDFAKIVLRMKTRDILVLEGRNDILVRLLICHARPLT